LRDESIRMMARYKEEGRNPRRIILLSFCLSKRESHHHGELRLLAWWE
jgi:hypothetical protein